MWYEILPTYLTITTLLSLPNLFVYFTNKLMFSQPFKRRVATDDEAYMYLRDCRISGRQWAYDFVGIDHIPDQPEGTEEA